MTSHDRPGNRPLGQHGAVGYLQLPARDVGVSAAFYQAVFGWSVESGRASFEAPGMIGQWTIERAPGTDSGPVVWICADRLWPTLQRIVAHGGEVHGSPQLDGGERWLVEFDDPAGNRVGLVTPATAPQSQTLLAVRDVEASSRWYHQLLGLRSDHGGPNYERLVAPDGRLVLQLHHWDIEHDHGRIGDPEREVGNGVLVWFGETADFDDVVARAGRLEATVVLPVRRNPPEREQNGPSHREIWIKDPDGYVIVIASPDGEAFHANSEPSTEPGRTGPES